MYHLYGNVSCKGVNVSNNKVRDISGILIQEPSTKSSISFSSFNTNIASGFECLEFYRGSHDVSYTNVIGNSQNSNSNGIIFAEYGAQLTMNHCSIFGNDPGSANVFFSDDSSCSIKCTDCSMTEDQMNSKSSYVTIDTASESFINYYEYFARNII